jgi:hypothetical protein
MNPRKNARRGYAARQAKRRAAQATRLAPKEGKIMNERTQNIGLGCLAIILVITALCAVVFFIWNPFGLQIITAQMVEAPAPTQVPLPTQKIVVEVVYPTSAPNDAPAATEAPIVTEAPTAPTEKPAARCESIQVSKDGGNTWIDAGLSLETESKFDIGDRETWTARSTLTDKAPDEKLTDEELKTVEQTWLDVKINTCNTEAVIFAGGFEMSNTKFDGGVLLSMKGERQFRVRNGEIVLWYDTVHRDKDLGRIVDQIKVGNFDIHGPLALAVADGLKDVKVVADFLATRPDVKIVILP